MSNLAQWTFGFRDLEELTGLSLNSLHQHHRRGNFDPEDLGSIVKFVARHGRVEIRREILNCMLVRDLGIEPKSRTRPARKKKRIKSSR